MLDAKRLLIFAEVARQRSFSRAAEALALTQPAVSQQIRALEIQVGTPLITRGPHTFSLTDTGALLLEHAEALAARLRLAEVQMAEAIATEHRCLRLGAFPSALATLVPAAIAILESSYAGLEVNVIQGDTETLVANVRDGTVHVGLCFQESGEPRHEPDGTTRFDFFEEPMVAALGPTHRLAERSSVRLSQLAGDPWVAATRSGLIWRACIDAGFEPRIAYSASDPLAIRALVAAGLAVTLTPRLLAGQLHGIATPALVRAPRRTIYALVSATGDHPLVAPYLEALRASSRDLDVEAGPTRR